MSQFSGAHPNLSDFIRLPGYYPAGRLDKDSEGLLLLTADGGLQSRISHPRFKMTKTYWVQVEGRLTDALLDQLATGINLKDGRTRPARVEQIDCPLPERDPPVRHRKTIPTAWIAITISEGRNRQVRRMTAALGLPTLRLYRAEIGPWRVDGIPVGEYRHISVNLPRN